MFIRKVKIRSFILLMTFASILHAGKPLWTFTPHAHYPSHLSLTSVNTAIVKYTVTNQSRKAHTLIMQPITGITPITNSGNCAMPVTLNPHQSCILSLQVNGNALTKPIQGGPVLCQQGNSLQCYQPGINHTLNIKPVPLAQYVISATSGNNGQITPASQIVLAGNNVSFTAVPDKNYLVDEWLVDGQVAQMGGTTFTLTNITSPHSVEATFTLAGYLYVGMDNGNVFFSSNHGINWVATTIPSPNHAVNSVFANASTLFVGSEDSRVYFSTNNGLSWSSTDKLPNLTEVNAVFVREDGRIYAGSEGGAVYYTDNQLHWTSTTTEPRVGHAVNGLYITSQGVIYAASSDGSVYFTNNHGSTWTKMSGPTIPESNVPIRNIFVANNQLFINTHHITNNTTLPPGTVDFEYVYSSDSLTSPSPTWQITSQIAYTLFVSSNGTLIYAGTQDGYVFSLTDGNQVGFISNNPINSLFFLEQF